MEKFRCLIMGIILLFALGFSHDHVEAKKPIRIKLNTFVDPEDKGNTYFDVVAQIIQRFEKETGIKVQYETLPWDQIDSKVVITNLADEPADVSWVSSQKLASLVNAGALLPLDQYVKATYTEKELADFAELERKATTSVLDGKKYMFLLSIHSRLLWYNKDIIKKPPRTWVEVKETARKATQKTKGIYGITFFANKHYGTSEVVLAPMIWSTGGRLSNHNGSAAFNSPNVAEAIKFLSELIHAGYVPKNVTTADFPVVENAFKAGQVGMIIDGSYMLNTFVKETEFGKAGKLGWAPIPGKYGPAPNFVNGWALGIPRNSKHPYEAWKLIEFFQRTDIQAMYSLVEGGAPTRKSAWSKPEFKTEVWRFILKNLDENGHPMDPFVYYQEGLESLSMAASAYFIDPFTNNIEALLDEFAEDFNRKF